MFLKLGIGIVMNWNEISFKKVKSLNFIAINLY